MCDGHAKSPAETGADDSVAARVYRPRVRVYADAARMARGVCEGEERPMRTVFVVPVSTTLTLEAAAR